MSDDLKLIKKYYGEKMMHLCRELFPTIIDKGLLFQILSNTFAFSKYLYDDIISNHKKREFKDFIFDNYNMYINETAIKDIEVDGTPKELLSKVGYDLYECKREEDIQQFKKYYQSGEELCTFEGGRLDSCYVFFAVKKDAENIKREVNPSRQDKYGTSVISIQFTKGSVNSLSIKNRYNHAVDNPDATFGNNLDSIIPGLKRSFEKEYNLNINQNTFTDFELINYININGKYYKYNLEVDGIYYCPDNIIISHQDIDNSYLDKSRYIVMDNFILDLEEKKVHNYTNYDVFKDSFPDYLQDIEKIEVDKLNNNTKKITISIPNNENIIIVIDKQNRIIEYYNRNIHILNENFLRENKTLKKLDITNCEIIENGCFKYNRDLEELNLPNCKKIGENVLRRNKKINYIYLPNITYLAHNFLEYNDNRVLLKQLFRLAKKNLLKEKLIIMLNMNNNEKNNINRI